jgi:hypothetical protein
MSRQKNAQYIVLTNFVDSQGIRPGMYSLGPVLTARRNLICWLCGERIATGSRYLRFHNDSYAKTCLHCAGQFGRPVTDESLPS